MAPEFEIDSPWTTQIFELIERIPTSQVDLTRSRPNRLKTCLLDYFAAGIILFESKAAKAVGVICPLVSGNVRKD